MGLSRTERPTPGQVPSLTSLRGVLALWVVGYHFWNDVVRLFPSARVLSPLMGVGHMAVPAFFMLSGYVLAYNYGERFRQLSWRGVGRFLVLRLGRIYPVHFVALLAVAAMVVVSDRVGFRLADAGYSTRDFLLNLALVHTWVPHFQLNWNYPSWSISSEWFAYLLFPYAMAWPLRKLTLPRAIVLGSIALGASVGVVLAWKPWPFYELVLVVPTFFTGVAIHGIVGSSSPGMASRGLRFLPESLMIVLILACFLPGDEAVTAILLVGFAILIFALARLKDTCHSIWSIWPAVYLGEVSYSLYMTHTLAQKVVYKLLPAARFEDSGTATQIGVLVAYGLLVAFGCLASYYLVELPSRRLMKRWVTPTR